MSDYESGLYPVTVKEMVRYLSKSYITLIETNTPFKSFPSVMVWGPPGVGKSQGVKKVAENIENKTGKKVVVTDVRLLLFNPVDLRGIPTSNEDKTLSVWLKPQIFQMDESNDVVNILFLDEISAAPPSVQAAAYQITLDRVIGEHKLPENCIVIAAGNRVTDRSVAYNMPRALANRLCHLEVKGDPFSWHDWALEKGMHKYVISYLEYNIAAMMRFEDESNLAFPTPRSWEMASSILKTVSENIDDVYPMLIGCVGHRAAAALKQWVDLYKDIPSVESIFLHGKFDIPQTEEQLIILKSEMVEYARNHPHKEQIDRSVEFACTLPWKFRGKLLHDYYYLPNVKAIIQDNSILKQAMRGASD